LVEAVARRPFRPTILLERTANAQFTSGGVACSALRRRGVNAPPTGGVGRTRCRTNCRRRREPPPADPHCQGATWRQRRATSSGSTIARSHSTAAVPNRGRTKRRQRKHEEPQMTMEREREHLAQVEPTMIMTAKFSRLPPIGAVTRRGHLARPARPAPTRSPTHRRGCTE
jgi:hypothetical protein